MIKLICVGKIKESSISTAIQEYQKRLAAFVKFSIIEVSESKLKDESQLDRIRQEEALNILKLIQSKDQVVLFDLAGKSLDSIEFSQQLMKTLDEASHDVILIIGGSHGVDDRVKQRSDQQLSFSALTFPHQLFRLLVCEQVYRAFMIAQHRSYHK